MRVLSRRHEHLLTKAFGEWQRWMVQEEALGATFVSLQARYEENFRLQASLDALQQQCLADKSAAGPSSSERERDLLAQLEASKAKSEQLEKSLRAAEDLSRERGVSLDLSDGRVSRLESQLSDAEGARRRDGDGYFKACKRAEGPAGREGGAAERGGRAGEARGRDTRRGREARAEAEASAVEARRRRRWRWRAHGQSARRRRLWQRVGGQRRTRLPMLLAASRKRTRSFCVEMELSSGGVSSRR